MGIVKLSKSKRQVQFVTDEGVVYGTSLAYMKYLIDGTLKGNFVLLSRMAYSVSPDRFEKSPVYGADETTDTSTPDYVSTTDDAYSARTAKEKEEKKIYNIDIKDF